MTEPTPTLSPAAQAVKDAAWGAFWSHEAMAPNDAEIIAAAALRAAAADQNKQIDVPFTTINQWEQIRGNTLSYWTAAQWGYSKAMSEILAIAAELESAS